MQQGAPLGPLLFALALQPVLQQSGLKGNMSGSSSSRSCGGLVFSYLDDCVLAGKASDVQPALLRLSAAAIPVGLTLKSCKSELFLVAQSRCSADLSAFPPDLPINRSGSFELLGGPVGSDNFGELHTRRRAEKSDDASKGRRGIARPVCGSAFVAALCWFW